jgi:hypothetical protein
VHGAPPPLLNHAGRPAAGRFADSWPLCSG